MTERLLISYIYIPYVCYIPYISYIYIYTHTTPVFLPGESHGQRGLTGYSLWGHKELYTTKVINNFTSKEPNSGSNAFLQVVKMGWT